jgi:endonuclease-3 related protein
LLTSDSANANDTPTGSSATSRPSQMEVRTESLQAVNSLPEIPPFNARAYYDALFAAHGPQHWWPGRTPFEIIVGAILVQNTSWTNVATAIEHLRRAKLLTPTAIEKISMPRLQRLIRSSGYFRQKTKKLKAFVRFLRRQYQGSLSKMFRAPTQTLREQLLAIHGIGPETADSILLYAAKHPVFVVDAYTRRILARHGHPHARLGYEDLRQLIERNLAPDVALYNEFHALIVHTGKHFCRLRDPRCGECPLKPLLPEALPATVSDKLSATMPAAPPKHTVRTVDVLSKTLRQSLSEPPSRDPVFATPTERSAAAL